MKTVRFFTLLFIATIITSAVQAQTKYEKLGISFSIPEGWKISDEEKGEGVFTFICEKKGDDAPSVSFVYIDGPTNIDDMLQSTMADYDNATMGQGQALNWEKPKSGTIGVAQYATREANYQTDNGRETESGTIYSFSLCGKTALLIFSDADQGHEKNVAAFETIKNSITCK